MVVMVLSQLRTRTVVNAMSITSPSAFAPGTTIQSPIWIIPLPESVTPAVRPRIESLKTNISTAESAVMPERIYVGSRPESVATTATAAKR